MLLLKYWGNPYPQSYTTIKIVVSRYVQKHLQKNLLPDTENPRSLVKSMKYGVWVFARQNNEQWGKGFIWRKPPLCLLSAEY